jgi:hypothetical protein
MKFSQQIMKALLKEIRSRGNKPKEQARKASDDPTSEVSKSSLGRFNYQETGCDPDIDSEGRVIVLVQRGNDLRLGINVARNIGKTATRYLLGKEVLDKEVNGRIVKIRLMPDESSSYANSVKVETPKGDSVGWVLREDEAMASMIYQLSKKESW